MSSKARYSPDDLESLVDSFRFSGNWDAAFKALERYAQVFDIGAATSSKQHWNVEDARCYYWSVMSEAMLEYTVNYAQALACVKKAAGFNATYPDWRIFSCRILLETADRCTNNQKIFDSDLPAGDLDPSVVLAEVLESNDGSDKLLQAFQLLPQDFQRVLLHVFSVIPTGNVVFICQHIMERVGKHQELSAVSNPKLWSFVSCRFILGQLSLENLLHSFINGSISDYRFWLITDAVVTRSILNELLGDVLFARADILHVLRDISPSIVAVSDAPLSPSPSLPQSDGNLGGVESLPGPVRRLLLYSAARLPLLEKSAGMAHEAYKSFRRCIGPESKYRSFFPPMLLLGLHVDAAELILRFAAGINYQSVDNRESSDQAEMDAVTPFASLPLQHSDFESSHFISLGNDVNLESALFLLRSCHEAISADPSLLLDKNKFPSTNESTSSQFIDIELSSGSHVVHNRIESELSIEFLSQSLSRRILKPLSDPLQLFSLATPCRISYLMAGIVTKIVHYDDQTSRRDSLTLTEAFEILQWGLSNESKSPLNLVWAVACCYVNLTSFNGFDKSSSSDEDHTEEKHVSTAESHEKMPTGSRRPRQYAPPHFFGGEEIEAALELLDQCIALIVQRQGDNVREAANRALQPSIHEGDVYNTLIIRNSDDVIDTIDYPELSVWFGLGHQPSKYKWLPFSLAAELCLFTLDDSPRAVYYVINGLRCLYSEMPGCQTCLQALGLAQRDELKLHNKKRPDETKRSDFSATYFDLPRASSVEGLCISTEFSTEQEISIMKFLGAANSGTKGTEGIEKLFFIAAQAHASWGRSLSLRIPERLLHLKLALNSLRLLLRSRNIIVGERNGCLSAESLQFLTAESRDNPFYFRLVSTKDLLLEYCITLTDLGELDVSIGIVRVIVSSVKIWSQFHHLHALLLDAIAAEAMNDDIYSANALACRRAMDYMSNKSGAGVWSYMNAQLSLVHVMWKHGDRDKALREMDDILSQLHSLTVQGSLMMANCIDTSVTFHTINRCNSLNRRAEFILETLFAASRYFRQVQNLDRSKACIEDAWRILFSTRDFLSGSGPGGGGLLWGINSDSRSNLAETLRSEAASAFAKASLLKENGVGALHNLTYWLDTLRSVPTFEGWRLSEASGWNVDSFKRRTCIASAAVQIGEILLADANLKAVGLCHSIDSQLEKHISDSSIDSDIYAWAQRRDVLRSYAIDFLNFAIAIDPKHVEALVSLASLELELCEDDSALLNSCAFSKLQDDNVDHFVEDEVQHLDLDMPTHSNATDLTSFSNLNIGHERIHKSISLLRRALLYDDLNFKAWCALGAAFERAGHIEHAAECFVRSLERSSFRSSRAFDAAIY